MRRLSSRIGGAALEGALVSLILIGLIAAPALAAKGGRPSPSVATGSCAVTPDPVQAGSTYSVNAWGLKADTVFTVRVSDSNGVQVFFIGSDAAGNASGSAYAYWSGTNDVSVTYQNRKKTVVAARCAFEVS